MMIIYLLPIALVLLAWLVFKPGWLPAPPENATRKVTQQAKQLKTKSGGWIQQVRSKLQRKNSLGAQLKAWALNEDLVSVAGMSKAEVGLLAVFQEWIQTLPADEVERLGHELAAFCEKQGVQIRWLLEDNGRGDMHAALSSMVLFYGMAARERWNAGPAAALRTWADAPMAKANRDFGNQLYVKLVNAGRITIPAELLLSSQKQRLAHQVSAIQAEMERDPEGLLPFAAQALEELHTPKAKGKPAQAVAFEAPLREQVVAQNVEAAV